MESFPNVFLYSVVPIALISEAPGEAEDTTLMPFVVS
jgi:uracil-DNA glycosylase